jgi:hypothetical protein
MVTEVKNVEVLGLKELEKFMKDELPDVFERRLETLKALRDSSESMLAGAKSNTDKFRKYCVTVLSQCWLAPSPIPISSGSRVHWVCRLVSSQ